VGAEKFKKIWVSGEVYEEAEEIAKRKGMTVDEFVLEAVKEKVGETST